MAGSFVNFAVYHFVKTNKRMAGVGAVIVRPGEYGCDTALFAPKRVEGARLITRALPIVC